MGPNPAGPTSLYEERVQTQAHPGRRLGEHGGEIQARHLEAKELLGLQKLKKKKNPFPGGSGGWVTLPTLRFGTSGLHTCEAINFCCFKSP